MLSILIPVYNWDVRPLVQNILGQCHQIGIPFEIIILDDDSTDLTLCARNMELSIEPEVCCLRNTTNQGRSKTRNTLAKLARHENLLFIDCDASILRQDFISQYIAFIQAHPNQDFAVLGGVAYHDMLPNTAHSLRWTYGIKREQKPATQRSTSPYSCFTPFNLLISASVFEKCQFDETLNSYGYEDTFFGEALQRNAISVHHIDNALYHEGLDDNLTYLTKVETSIDNLVKLMQQNRISQHFIQSSKLLSVYYKCRKHHLSGIVRLCLKAHRHALKAMILKRNSLKALDLYKLLMLMEKA